MARKKGDDSSVKTDGWMNTFSDLMNLLLCFFVMLFAMSTVDADKWQQLVASFSSSYSVLEGNGQGISDDMLIASGVGQLNELSEYYENAGLNEEGEGNEVDDALIKLEEAQINESEQMGDIISQMLENRGMGSEVEVQVTQHYVCLNMKGALLFESASATLTDDARRVLTEVGNILKLYEDNLVEIEGHTDNVPMLNDPIFTNNNVLSAYRAMAVFDYIVNDCGVSPANLKCAGRGEYSPIASNDTAEGRAQNRRVEIKIYNSYSSY